MRWALNLKFKAFIAKRSALAHNKKLVCQRLCDPGVKNFNHIRHKAFFKVRTESSNKLRAISNF